MPLRSDHFVNSAYTARMCWEISFFITLRVPWERCCSQLMRAAGPSANWVTPKGGNYWGSTGLVGRVLPRAGAGAGAGETWNTRRNKAHC